MSPIEKYELIVFSYVHALAAEKMILKFAYCFWLLDKWWLFNAFLKK